MGVFLMRMGGAGPVAGLSGQEVTADPPCPAAADVAAEPRIGGECLTAVLGTAERHIAAPEEAGADLLVEVAGHHEGELDPIVIVGAVKERPVRKRAVAEIVAMGVQLVQIAERPERAAGLEPKALRQAGAGQGLDIGFLQLELGRLAGMDAEAEREGAAELVVDIAGERDLAVAEREALVRTFRFVAQLKAGEPGSLRRVAGQHAVQDDADLRIEAGVAGPLSGRCRLWLGGLGFGELRLERRHALLVVLFQSFDLCGQLRRRGHRRRLRLGRVGGEQNRQSDRRRPRKSDESVHRHSPPAAPREEASPFVPRLLQYIIANTITLQLLSIIPTLRFRAIRTRLFPALHPARS